MPKKKRYPDTGAIRFLAAAHGHADTELIVSALREASGDPGRDVVERESLAALAREHELANDQRHEFVR